MRNFTVVPNSHLFFYNVIQNFEICTQMLIHKVVPKRPSDFFPAKYKILKTVPKKLEKHCMSDPSLKPEGELSVVEFEKKDLLHGGVLHGRVYLKELFGHHYINADWLLVLGGSII